MQAELPNALNQALHNQEERGAASQITSGNFSFHPTLELAEFFHFFKGGRRAIWIC